MKKQLISIILIICLTVSLFMFSSCGGKKAKYLAYSLDYFDTATSVTGYESDRETFDRVSGEILAALGEYHKLFTIYDGYEGVENLYTINSLIGGVHPVVEVDRAIIDMLLYAKEMYDLTGGKMNVAMGSVLSIWHNYRTAGLDDPLNATLPSMDELRAAALHTDINDLVIDEENSTVWLADPLMTLDVGAVAKGYAVERVARSLEERGISGYIINVGGNVRTVGSKPDGEKWLVGIENPDRASDPAYVEYLLLEGESIVTSGSYQRLYTVNGVDYHHIIDSATLMPAERYLSVSVVCRDSGLGDALSTALFCMPLDEGRALVESLQDVEALWILVDGSKAYSSGFSAYVTEI